MFEELWNKYHNDMLEKCYVGRCEDCEWIKILCSITFVGYDNNVETIENFMAGKECKSYAKVKPNLRTRFLFRLKNLLKRT